MPGVPGRTWASVSVPATSANLGTGFDAVGIALGLRDTVSAQVIDDGLEIEVSGEGAGTVPRDDTHLVVRTLRAALDEFGVEVPGLRLRCENRIPHSRGLGSSAAAIVAGLALGLGLAGRDLDLGWLDDRSARLEGHPDNSAAAVHGGAVLAWIPPTTDEAVVVDPLPLAAGLEFVALIPDREVPTAQARKVLPDLVPRLDAVQQAIRSSFLVRALTQDPRRLLFATEDRLHQPYRSSLMPESWALVQALRARGVPAVVSGAGPTVLALGGPGLVTRCRELPPDVLDGFALLPLGVAEGVRVERSIPRADGLLGVCEGDC